MKRFLILTISSLLFFNCASPVKPYNDITRTSVSEPEVGVVVTKSVGDALVTQGTLYTIKAVFVSSDCLNGNVRRGAYQAVATRKFTTGDEKNIETKNVIRFGGTGISGDKWNATGYYLEYCIEDNVLYYVWTAGSLNVVQSKKKLDVDFRITEMSYPSSDSFQQTLLYLGKSGSVLRFGYREFYEDRARPDFSNEVSYDLNDSHIIGYKNAKIKVIEATNTELKYELLSNF